LFGFVALLGLAFLWTAIPPAHSQDQSPLVSAGTAQERAPAAAADPSFGERAVAYLWQMQRSLQRDLAASFRSYKEERSAAAAWLLISLGFLYGLFHAAGPGHGKAVISAYLLAHGRQVRRGLVLSTASALLQGITAIVLVEVTVGLLGLTGRSAQSAASTVETVSFALTAAIGAWLSMQALRRLCAHLLGRGAHSHAAHHHDGHACHHVGPQTAARGGTTAGILLSIGLRPCSGAVLILVLAHAFDMRAVGIGAVAAMSIGTAAAVGVLALLTLYTRRLAVAVASGRSRSLAVVGQGFVLLAGLTILALGASLLIGSLQQSPASLLS
jgi:ABC-type nickel/cobalt efflux system permease component RcnA